jgi:hypothetical protein
MSQKAGNFHLLTLNIGMNYLTYFIIVCVGVESDGDGR